MIRCLPSKNWPVRSELYYQSYRKLLHQAFTRLSAHIDWSFALQARFEVQKAHAKVRAASKWFYGDVVVQRGWMAYWQWRYTSPTEEWNQILRTFLESEGYRHVDDMGGHVNTQSWPRQSTAMGRRSQGCPKWMNPILFFPPLLKPADEDSLCSQLGN